MRSFVFGLMLLQSWGLSGLEFEVQLDNDAVTVARVKIMPNDEIGLHRDEQPQVVIALQGGVITRLEADGTTTDVHFPTNQAVFRDVDPPEQLHKSVNQTSAPVELMIIQLKKKSLS